MWFGRTVNERALRPVRWSGRPGGGTLLRGVLVTVLLGLATVILSTAPSPTCALSGRRPATAPTATARAATGPTATAPTGGPATGGPEGGRPATGRPEGGGVSGGPPAGWAGDRSGGRLPLPEDTVGVPVRLAEPAALAVVRPGSRVDLLAVPTGSPVPVLVAPRALVLDVVGAEALDGSSALYLALSPPQAERTVGLPEGSRFAILVRS